MPAEAEFRFARSNRTTRAVDRRKEFQLRRTNFNALRYSADVSRGAAMPTNPLNICREFLRKLLHISRRPHGAESLRRHIEAADRETRPVRAPKYRTECGGTDFEPTSTCADRGRVRVLKLRCRACGQINSF